MKITTQESFNYSIKPLSRPLFFFYLSNYHQKIFNFKKKERNILKSSLN